jgi:hypothetical protein
MRLRTYGEHTYSQAQLSAFAETQTKFEDACYRQSGVPYGFVPPRGTPLGRAGNVMTALRMPLVIAGWGFRVLYVLVAVPLIVIWLVSVVGVMFARGW